MDPSRNSRLTRFFRNVASTSRVISQAVSGSNISKLSTLLPSIQPPVLPLPPNILPELRATGAPASVITEELEHFERGCLTLRQQAETAMAKIIQGTPNLLSSGISLPETHRSVHVLEDTYLKYLHELKTHTLKRACNAPPRTSSRTRFNQGSTPLLKKYFRNNAYPSTADRAMLAQKTRMTLRQIEVWFQNRRRRVKAEGKPLPRCPYDANPDDYNLEEEPPRPTSYCRCPSTPNSSPEISDEDSNNSTIAPSWTAPLASVFRWIAYTPVDIVKTCPPSHAFPTRFSPSKDHDPFPFKPSYSEYEWYRKATTNSKRKRQPTVDMDALERDFQLQLRVFEKSEKSSLKRKRSDDDILTLSRNTTSYYLPPRSQTQASPEPIFPHTEQVRPTKRRLVQTPRLSSRTFVSGSRSSSGCSSGSSSSSTSSPQSIPTSLELSPVRSFPQHFLSQRFSWHTSKFAQWSSIPSLTLNCNPVNIPLSHQ